MKYLKLIRANLFRKKFRAVMTIGSFAVSLFLFGLLATIDTAFNQGIEIAGVDRLIVRNRTSLIMPLPFSYRDRLANLEGVQEVTYACWFGGIYQDPKNFIVNMAIDKDSYFKVYQEFIVAEDEMKSFLKDREGCIVGRKTAEKYAWKIGDRVPLQGTIWPGIWEFNICGIYDGKRKEDDTTQFWFRYDYLEEARKHSNGTVGWYIAKVTDPEKSASVLKAIDDTFMNSPWETKTETESAFNASFVKQMGNIKLIILSVGAVVFITLLLVTGNTMAIAVKERANEIAILKAIGFSGKTVSALIIAENMVLPLLGGGTGLIFVKLFTLRGDPTGGFLPLFYLSPANMIKGFFITVAVGLISIIIPALLVLRLKVVDALRRV